MGKTVNKNTPSPGSHTRVGLEKDIDWHNQRLWKRKKYTEQIKKQNTKKVFKEFKRTQ